MKVLVTGASGAIGRVLTPVLDAAGIDVWTTDRLPLDRDQHIVTDLADPESVRSLADVAPDGVVHLAGILGSDIGQLFPANVLGTVNLLEALAPGTRVVVAGSAAEYGEGKGVPLAESDPLSPVNAYGWSKVAQTTISSVISDRRALQLTVVRPFNIINPQPPPTTALGNMRRQLIDAGSGRTASVVTGRLDVIRDYVPIDFVANVLATVVQDSESTGTFNACSGVGIELGSILQAMGRLRGVEIIVEPDPHLVSLPAASIVTGDPEKLANRFGLSVRPDAESIASLVLGIDPSPPAGT